LYLHGVKPNEELSCELVNELKEEMNGFFLKSLCRLSSGNLQSETASMKKKFHSHLGLSTDESVLKVSVFHLLLEKGGKSIYSAF